MNNKLSELRPSNVSFGEYGFDLLTTGLSNTQVYRVLQAVTSTTLTVFNEADDVESTLTIPTGMLLYGDFSSVNISNGSVIAYLSKERV